jgi:hypothetical protein
MKFYFLTLGTILVVCIGCHFDGSAQLDGQQIIDRNEYVAPPAHMMAHPGPGVAGPGPGVMPMMGPPQQRAFQAETTQVRFTGPQGMSVGWQHGPGFAENQLVTPARYNFVQGATFRLKLTNVPGREGLVIYPTLQVYPSDPTTDAYLSHNSVPLEITDEDLEQVESNNFVSKVIFLPDPKFQELAIAGVETLVSTKLEPGVDPVAEASRRGTVMLVMRMGNMDVEMPGIGSQPSAEGAVEQVSYWTLDGNDGQRGAPTPIAINGQMGVPGPMMVGGSGGPGRPAMNPISGMGGVPTWGMPITSTPIGLPGPPHLPLGHTASMQSHTIRNLTEYNLPKPVDHMLIDVKHDPGYNLPAPVKHIQYEEKHPVFSPGEVSEPRWNLPQGR